MSKNTSLYYESANEDSLPTSLYMTHHNLTERIQLSFHQLENQALKTFDILIKINFSSSVQIQNIISFL